MIDNVVDDEDGNDAGHNGFSKAMLSVIKAVLKTQKTVTMARARFHTGTPLEVIYTLWVYGLGEINFLSKTGTSVTGCLGGSR